MGFWLSKLKSIHRRPAYATPTSFSRPGARVCVLSKYVRFANPVISNRMMSHF